MSSAEWAVIAVTALGFSPVGLRLISAPDMATPLTTRINVTIQKIAFSLPSEVERLKAKLRHQERTGREEHFGSATP